jgi:cytochrome c551/c552
MHKFITMTITLVLLGLLCTANQSRAGNGEALFDSLKCGACHKPDQKTVAISLKEIAKAYEDQAKLVAYLKGESPMIIESTKAGMMKGPLKNLAGLTDEEKKTLADYILSFK